MVETKQDLELGLSKFMFELSEGEVRVVGTNEVQQPELTIIEKIYAGSKSEATGFYKKNGSGVGVKVDSDSLSVKEKSSSGVVSGGSGNVPTAGGSSQLPRREMQVVLKVPVAKNVNEGETSKPESERAYSINVDFGDIRVENTTGKYDIFAGSGKVVIERCRMEESKIVAGDIEVAGTTFNLCTITTLSGNVGAAGTTFNSSTIKTVSGNVGTTGTTFNLCTIETVSGNVGTTGTTFNSSTIKTKFGNIEATGIFRGINIVRTESGNISFKFDRGGQGEVEVIEVQTSSGGGAIQTTKSFFKGVKNPNGQTARLSLITQAGKIEVNE